MRQIEMIKKTFFHICRTQQLARDIFRDYVEGHLQDRIDFGNLRIESDDEIVKFISIYNLDKVRGSIISDYKLWGCKLNRSQFDMLESLKR